MKANTPVAFGILLAPICVLALGWHWSGAWVLCPQALIVMFARQCQSAYDSLGAAGYPDLAVAALYYPILGWFLRRAAKAGRFRSVSVWAGLLHMAAIALAWAAAETRNKIWDADLGR